MNNELEQAAQSIMKRDESKLTLKQKLEAKKNRAVLLLDVSGSMATDIEPNRSRIDALRSIVEDLKVTYETYAFSTYINKIDQKHIPSPNGGTRLGHALDQLLHNNRKKVVLITDGEAEDPARCLELAKNFELAIMYVGSGDRPQFLDDLANAAHGTCSTEDLRQKELTEKITLLLGSGSQVGDIQI